VNNVFTKELERYKKFHGDLCRPDLNLNEDDVVGSTYVVWEMKQKAALGEGRWRELDYDLLEHHPDWIPLEERRKHFRRGNQTRIENG
jgi:hypothetical protein